LHEEVEKQSKIVDAITNTWRIEAESILSLITNIDMEAVCKAVKVLSETKGKAVIAGCGTSGAAAKKIVHSLCCVQCPATFLSPSDAVHGALGVLQPEDVLILISKGGNTTEIINLIPASKTKGLYLIGVTENEGSLLAKEANLFIKVKVDREPCPFGLLATASSLAVMAVFDAICIGIMLNKGYKREQFAVVHPGGAVGDKLLNKG
jgi:KpsF/GutQ family protein